MCYQYVLCKSSYKVISDTHLELLIRTPNKTMPSHTKPNRARWIRYSFLRINSTWNWVLCVCVPVVAFVYSKFLPWITLANFQFSSDWQCYQQSMTIQPSENIHELNFFCCSLANISKHLLIRTLCPGKAACAIYFGVITISVVCLSLCLLFPIAPPSPFPSGKK